MKYSAVLEILFSPENADAVPEGFALSEAVCERHGNRMMDVFFTYILVDGKKNGLGPLAKIVLDAEQGKILAFSEYEDQERFSLDRLAGQKETADALDLYESLYPEIKGILEKDTVNEAERNKLRLFTQAFQVFTNEEMRMIYRRVSSEMMDSVEKLISGHAH